MRRRWRTWRTRSPTASATGIRTALADPALSHPPGVSPGPGKPATGGSEPGFRSAEHAGRQVAVAPVADDEDDGGIPHRGGRSEEHTSELQSRENLVCRL